MRKKKYLTPTEKKDKVLAYLKEKYQEEFVPISMNESSWGQGHDVIYLCPKNGTEEHAFTLWGTLRDDGNYAMQDGYFGVIIKDKYEAVLSDFVKEIYSEFKLYTRFGKGIVFPDRLNKATKISDLYRKNELFTSDTVIFVKQSSAQGIDLAESLKKIAQEMKEEKLAGKVTLYIVFDDKYEIINLEILNKNTEDYFVDCNRKYIWVDQNLEIDEVK